MSPPKSTTPRPPRPASTPTGKEGRMRLEDFISQIDGIICPYCRADNQNITEGIARQIPIQCGTCERRWIIVLDIDE